MGNRISCEIKEVAGHKDIVVVKMVGELDAVNTKTFGRTLAESLPAGADCLICDLTEVQFIDSTGNLFLFRLHMEKTRKGGWVKIFGVNENLRDVLDIVGLSKLVPVYETYEDVLKSLK